MCGLSGVMSSSLSDHEQGMFKDLFNISSLRGVEGSGVIVAQKDMPNKAIRVERIRSPYVSGALAYSNELAALTKPPINLLVGHARWPTKGGTDREALHPHRTNQIIGVHNGTLHRVAGDLVKDGQSDSALMFKAIAEKGLVGAIEDTDGAYALIWVDEEDQTINFLRNGQRTLHFTNIGWQKNIGTLFWSSERDMLNLVLSRSFKGTNTWDTYLPPDKHFKYPLKVEHRIEPISVTEVKPKPKVYPAYGGYGQLHREYDWEKAWSDYDAMDAGCPFEAAPKPGMGPKPVGMDAVERIIRGANLQPIPRPAEVVALRSLAPALKKLQEEIDEARANWTTKKSKNASKKYVKLIQRRSSMIDEAVKKAKEKDKPLALPSPSVFQDADQSIFRTNGQLNDSVEDLFVGSSKGNNYGGRCCSWCGSPVNAGEKVYPLDYSDLGGRDKEFACWDCGTHNADCKSFLHESVAVVACN